MQKRVRELRRQGKSYSQIQELIGKKIAKSTLSYWCRGIKLPDEYEAQIKKLMAQGARKGRATALATNSARRRKERVRLEKELARFGVLIRDKEVGLVALSMLCLGEAFKYNSRNRQFYLGSSDPRIIQLFLGLLRQCFEFDIEKVRCTVQCRADQDAFELGRYWREVTKIPRRLFYKTRIDPRTKGRPTLNKDYKGVLRMDYFDSRVPKTLDVLYNLLAKSVWDFNFPDKGR